ncbi:kinase of RNA polymerase II carboxy-terminal domain, alpha subunit [Scheffersomyces coipomensis]|uniref:kinase of RNA polymerase II carboxy-terminal domain, alpha subunit n=1 Tax=Scheffersomyces coipomensis TaxID=1788519 RepID=UPI00315CC587
MSDKYRPPPSGPRSQRNYSSSYGSSSSSYSKDTYKPSGPRRYNNNNNNNNKNERDSYRTDVYKPTPSPSLEEAAASSSSSSSPSTTVKPLSTQSPIRPSGPSKYRERDNSAPSTDRDIGSKRPMIPSGPSSFKKQQRDYSSSFVGRRPEGPKGFAPPKGPREFQRPTSSGSNRYIPSSSSQSIELPKLSPSQIYSIKVTRSSKIFDKVQQVGEGTYGKVYKAKNNITNDYVALKKLRLETEREGFPITSIREIKLLQSCDHPNIVGLLEMMVENNQIYMVFDYLDHDLTGLLTHPDLNLKECHRKFIFKQLMEGLNYLHKKRIIHRDIKGSNILLDSTGYLKIADFGLARSMKILNDGESPDYTNRVITIWYRPPELLLGATDYGTEIDIWGVGCLLIELYSRNAAFQGYDEVSQLCKIFNVMGTPTKEDWPNIHNLPWFEMLKPKVNVSSKFNSLYKSIMSPLGFDLASKLLALDPIARLSGEEALAHSYFIEDPQPEPLTFLKDIKGEWHEFETKKRRRKERKRLQDEAKAKQQQLARTESTVGDNSMKTDVDSVSETLKKTKTESEFNKEDPNDIPKSDIDTGKSEIDDGTKSEMEVDDDETVYAVKEVIEID